MFKKSIRLVFVVILCLPNILFAQTKVESYHHDSTAEGNILRGRADAVVALSQARLINEQAIAQRLENMIRDCDVAYKQFSTRNQMQNERREHDAEMVFDSIKFNQQLLEIRRELELKAAMEHPGTGDPTNEMNLLLKKFTQNSFDKNAIAAMKTELSPEQLQAIRLSDGTNTFTAVAGKTKLETLKWPFLIQKTEFKEDREEFEKLYAQAKKESDDNKNPSPETIVSLLEKEAEIEKKVETIKLSTKTDLPATETKWRSEAKNYLREVNQSLNNYSLHDSERLKKYVFSGKTMGDLVEHMVSKGLRFSHPNKEDNNLYASIFFIMRYAYQGAKSGDTNSIPEEAALNTPQQPQNVTYTFNSRESVLRDFGVEGNWDVLSNDLVFRDGPPSKATSKVIYSYPISIEYQMYIFPDHPFDLFPGFADIQLYYACYSNSRTRLRLGQKQIELPHVKAVTNHLYRIVFSVDNDRTLVIQIDGKEVVRQRVDEQVSLKGPIVIDGEFGHVGCRGVVVRTEPFKQEMQAEKPTVSTTQNIMKLLQKKLHGKVAYDSKTGEFVLTYDWASKKQLEDFDLVKAKPEFIQGSLALRPGDSISYIVDFEKVKVTVPVLVPTMRGPMLKTSSGVQISMGGGYANSIFLDVGKGAIDSGPVPDFQQKGVQQVCLIVEQERVPSASPGTHVSRECRSCQRRPVR
jgi:hypothetical protein